VLCDLREIIAPGGLLIFSSHNLDQRPSAQSPGRAARLSHLFDRNLTAMLRAAPRVVRRAGNRRRLVPMQYRAADHAMLNDSAHDYALLHYYIGRDNQERQLEDAGFELLECRELEGRPVGPGERTPSASLYYVARSRP
jgi:hypothetical protein